MLIARCVLLCASKEHVGTGTPHLGEFADSSAGRAIDF